ncbi:unnamed protein product [Miscanthus lutarioriparius]|uniref:Legume lectin domain-containing protein n=1 Tax=Miscanthus lutarioriparius TaxID=422564 RepID=A0A811RFV8_9POAL|nr:unnamed protein product [Miscanthus lutarioriparius]
MAVVRVSCRSSSGLNVVSCSSLCCCLWMLLSIHVPGAGSLSFNLSFSHPQSPANLRELLNCTSDATIEDTEGLHLTKDIMWSVGRAQYVEAMRLWDRSSGEMASFTTTFHFDIKPVGSGLSGDGLAFFLVPPESGMPAGDSRGGALGILPRESKYNNITKLLVADLNINNTWYNVNKTIDLRKYLPEYVTVGFSAATGSYAELHQILSWSFTSTLQEPPVPAPALLPLTPDSIQNPKKRSVGILIIAVLVPLLFLLACAAVLAFLWMWGLYGRNTILDAADERLRAAGDEANDRCMERVLVVGLWCAHPDQNERPSIAQAMHVLQSEDARLPELTPQMYRTVSEFAVTGRAIGALSVQSSSSATTATAGGHSKVSSESATSALLRDSKELG